MRLASQYLPGAPAKLALCCEAAGIQLSDAHHALADTESTAALLSLYIELSGDYSVWSNWLDFGEAFPWPMLACASTTVVTRGAASPGNTLLQSVAGSFTRVEGLDGADEYLDLLDRVLLNRNISGPERQALDALALQLDLTQQDITRLNRHYMLNVGE
ncbi:MAG: hypothetical protein CVT64_11140 [Actinobacteria bacterium HGW-Actinobacteria-4]|nr:MAG: hypothetical protein CVT64_11140 [Actinobacteria bacterium HGW-Actinobacteria-4]